jgi:hypothetical protein
MPNAALASIYDNLDLVDSRDTQSVSGPAIQSTRRKRELCN